VSDGARSLAAELLVYTRKDSFYSRAKAAGFRSRAAYKLQQLATKARLFRPGDAVVDLGAWPGGWLQVAAQHVGPTGKVVGVDMRKIERLPLQNVVIVTADVTAPDTADRIIASCGGLADVVLSDLAPALTGVRERDVARAQALNGAVLQLIARILKPGGRLVIKLFMSPELLSYVGELRTRFGDVRMTRPEATRKGSAEVYAVATDFRDAGGAT
jgi:23S rRNA (uridine2552-2'-O)-methyltransferase